MTRNECYITGKTFQSTPPARGATTLTQAEYDALTISIHAPREGGDRCGYQRRQHHPISIHAPREGGDTPCTPTMTRR